MGKQRKHIRRSKHGKGFVAGNRYVLARSILGNEVFKDTKTDKEYLITWDKYGKPHSTKIR